MIFTKFYCNMDYYKINNVNVEHDHTFEIHL
jgi:hypothetical protein